MTRLHALLTNDDGIHAQGIHYLWESVTDQMDVSIVAPDRERSGSGLSITWAKPLKADPHNWVKPTPAWSLSGTPADCVKMGCTVLLKNKPHIVLSGINRGSNSGRTILYSGTVGGVIEATLRGIPGIAFSFCDFDFPSTNTVKQYIFPIIEYVLNNPLPNGTFLNVTFPHTSERKIRGFKLTKQGLGYWTEMPDKRIHPGGNPYYWLGGQWSQFKEEMDSDVALLEEGYITAVPIHISQLTDLSVLKEHKEKMEALFASEQAQIE